MKKLLLLSVFLATQGAYAITISERELAAKPAAISSNDVSFQGAAKTVLTDAKKMSVYTFDLDHENQSVCKGQCLAVWPPLTVDSNDGVVAPFGTITGNNGKLQLTLRGLPLYYFASDSKPGDINGHYPKWQLVFVEN